MADRSLTAGAQRAIARAEELAREWAHPELLPAHLLWSLLLEESEAFELLTTAGVTQDELKLSDIWHGQYPASFEDEGDGFSKPPVGSPVLSGLENDADDAAAALADAVNSALAGALGCSAGSDASLRESQDWQQVMLAARQLVARRKPAAETSTIHLLLALQAEASPVAALLERFDVELNWEADAVDRTATYRILDASANRLREGLRVVEDFVRFVLDDAHLSRLVKNCRHTLRMVLDPLDSLELIASRDTRADVGTSIRTEAEGRRGTPLEVATASLKRAQEAARTLEEYSKLLSADGGPTASDSLPQQLGQLRYELYTLEKAILVTVAADRQLNDRRLYLLLTSELCAGDVEQTLRDAITGGVDIVQLREKALSDRDLLALARRVREITRESGTLFVMNDRPDLAVLCDADGVHVGQEELSVAEVRRVVGPGRLVGVSTHSIEQARQAVLDGASYLGVGPVFPSRTKSFEQFAGLDFVRQVAGEIALPWFPIGGITPANLSQVTGAGAIRAAVCGAVLQARSPAEASSDLAEELRRAASLVRTVSQ
jgi:thiamine-phosphate pyrophosphorylase